MDRGEVAVKVPHARKILFCVFLFCGAVLKAAAQGKGPGGGGPPGGAPPGAHGPGGFGGMGGGLGANSPSDSASHSTLSRTGLQAVPVGRWWDDRSAAQAIGLRKDQQKKMDAIFKANQPGIVESYKAYLSQRATLDSLSKQSNVDQSRVFAAIDSVSQSRASLEKAYTQMLLQIRQQLDADQIQKLEKVQ